MVDIYFMDGEWDEIQSTCFFIPPYRKKKNCLAFVYSRTKLFLRIEYFMMGWKHSKERRQFHFDCRTSADTALWQRYVVTEIEQKSFEEIVLRFFKFSSYLIFSSKFTKLQFKRHAKITRRVNIGMGRCKDRREEIKKKESFAFQFALEISFHFIRRVNEKFHFMWNRCTSIDISRNLPLKKKKDAYKGKETLRSGKESS